MTDPWTDPDIELDETTPDPNGMFDDAPDDVARRVDEDDALQALYDEGRHDRTARRHKPRAGGAWRPKPNLSEVYRNLTDVEDTIETGLTLTYRASRHEEQWIMQALGIFFMQGIITDVLRLAKGGKEANVYVCAAARGLGVEHLAAKIYRPRAFRGLRNDAVYRAGRRPLDGDGKLIKDSRAVHAMHKGTGFGKELAHTSWLAHEHEALARLHAAGADVPRPFALGENVVLMDYIGDAARPAPALNHVRLERREARPLFDRVVWNIDVMLASNLIHGDLSAYNILYWDGAITLIDFPQVVNPFENPAGRALFERDVARVGAYFAPYGIDVDAPGLAASLWERYVPGDLWEVLPPAEEPPDVPVRGPARSGRR